MQKSDGSSDRRIDGSPPDPYKAPSWRGVLLMLAVIAVILALGAYAYLSAISQPGGPDVPLPAVVRH
jgi:hypothetical protein